MKPPNRKSNFCSTTRQVLHASLVFFASACASNAAAFTWDGGGADANSATIANWNPDAIVTANSDITFGVAGISGTTINWTSGNIFSMTFAAGASAYTMTNAGGFQFNQANAGTIVNNSSNLQTFSSDVRLFFTGAKTFNANTANLSLGVVTFRADSMTAGQTNTLALTGASNGIINGAINTSGTFDNLATGLRNAVTKTGSGSWELAGINTYGGLTSVQAGTLTLSGNRTTAMTGGITLGGGGAVAQTLNIQNGNFTLGASFTLGNGGSTSIVNHSAGTIAATGGSQILLGNGNGNSTYNLSGGALSGLIRMGVNSAPTANVNVFDLSGGALTTTGLQIGRTDAAGSFNTTNTFKQTNGTATVTNLSIGGATADAALTSNISGTLNLTGGTFTNTTFSSLSAAGASTSAITIGGTANVTLGAFPTARGTGSTATITFDGGTLKPAAASTAYMGGLTNAFVTANGAKFDVATGNDITISQSLINAVSQVGTLTKLGVGVLTLSGANSYSGLTTISAGTLRIGAGSTAGTLGSGSVTNNSVLEFNRSDAQTITNAISGTGTIYQIGAGATTLDPGAVSLSSRAISANGGNLILKSGTLATTGADPFNGAYNVGAGARGGTLTINGATLNIGGGKMLKVGAAANGNLDIISGTVTAADLVLGHNGTSVGTQSGGTVTVTNVYHQDGGTGTYTLSGGSLTAQRIYNNTASTNDFNFNLNGGTLYSAAGTVNLIDTDGVTGNDITVRLGAGNTIIDTTASSATIVRSMGDMPSVAGAFTKAGINTLTLTSASTYTGATTVTAGTLLMGDAAADTFATSGVTVASGATLGGSGVIAGTVGVTGILAPGNGGIGTLAAGTTTWNGAAVSAAETIWQFDLSATAGSSDTLAITGDFKLAGGGTVYEFDFMNSAPVAWGNTYTLATWTGATDFTNANQFSWSNLGGSFNGLDSYFTLTGVGVNTGGSLTFTAVPEPTSAFAGLLIGAGLLRRRRSV